MKTVQEKDYTKAKVIKDKQHKAKLNGFLNTLIIHVFSS